MDARGIAQLLRMGWYRPVHCKAVPAQEIRALLAGRKLLLGKLRDLELSLRGLRRGFGLPSHGADAPWLACGSGSSAVPPMVGQVSKGRFEARVRGLITGHHRQRR